MNSHPLFLYNKHFHSLRPLGRLCLPRCAAFAASLPFACPQQHAAGAGSPAGALLIANAPYCAM